MENLLSPVEVGDQKVAYVRQLRALGDILRVHAPSTIKSRIDFSQLMSSVTIADNDGDFVFLDPADGFSVWLFEHDCGRLTCFGRSLLEWLGTCRIAEAPTTDGAVPPMSALATATFHGIRNYLQYVLTPRGLIDREKFFEKWNDEDVLVNNESKIARLIADRTAEIFSVSVGEQRVDVLLRLKSELAKIASNDWKS